MPISPGVVQGRVKVFRHATDKQLLPGEILVARATDPGWTPLFINARGIILEIGGALQHGAVVAREYGIPCVSGLDDATTNLKDGQLVEVDGSHGLVRILEPRGVSLIMLRLAKYAKPYLGWLLLVIGLQFAQVNFDLAVPDYLARMVNTGIQAGAGTAYILSTGVSMLILTLLSGACMVAVVFIASRVAAGLAHDLRRDLFKKVSSFSNAEFDRFSTASLITRSTNDITQVQQVVMMLIRIVFYAVLMSIGGILRMWGQNVSMLWLIAGASWCRLRLSSS